MHGLPKGFDGMVFVGRCVEQVCFSQNTLHLDFGDDLSITSESLVVHERVADGGPVWSERVSVPVETCGLMRLIGPSITHSRVVDDANLILEFEDGQILHIMDDSKTYESYRIRVGDREIFV